MLQALAVSMACGQATFPLIFGRDSNITTDLVQIDYNAAVDSIVAGGSTKNSDLTLFATSPSGQFVPIVVLFKGPSMRLTWGKVLRKEGYEVGGLTTNPTGTRVLIHTSSQTPSYIFSLNMADGVFISARLYSNNDKTYNYMARNMLLSSEASNNFGILANKKCSQGNCYLLIIKFNTNAVLSAGPETTQFTIQSSNSGSLPWGVSFATQDGGVYLIHSTTSKLMISVINSANGNLYWTWGMDNFSNLGLKSCAIKHAQFISDFSHFIAAFSYNTQGYSVKYIRIIRFLVPPKSAQVYEEPNGVSKGWIVLGLQIQSASEIFTILMNPYAQFVFISTVNFDNFSIKYKKVLPEIPNTLVYLATFTSTNEYFIPTQARTFCTNEPWYSGTTENIGSSKNIGNFSVIYSSNSDKSCYSNYDEPEFTQTTISIAKVITIVNMSQSSGLAVVPSIGMTTEVEVKGKLKEQDIKLVSDLDLIPNFSIASWCQQKPFINLSTTQTKTTLYYSQYTSAIPITPFTATYQCGSSLTPSFYYQLEPIKYVQSLSDPSAPSNISLADILIPIDQLQVELLPVVAAAEPKNGTIIVSGSIGNYKIQQEFTLIASSNLPPQFDSPLQNHSFPVFSPLPIIIQLPTYSDSEDDSISIDIFQISIDIDQTKSLLNPDILQYDTLSNVIIVMQSDFNYVGDYQVLIELSDQTGISEYNMTISITNTAPHFVVPLQNVTIPHNQAYYYSFPEFIDDEGNQATLTFSAQQSVLPDSFTYDSVSITIAPSQNIGVFAFNVILSDSNKFTEQTLTIEVTNSAPYFQNTPSYMIYVRMHTDKLITFGDIVDAEGDNSQMGFTYGDGSEPPPIFLQFEETAIKVTQPDIRGLYYVMITLGDGMDRKEYDIFINVFEGLPYFIENLATSLTVSVNEVVTYKFPEILSPVSNFPITIELLSPPNFVTFDAVTHTLTFKPTSKEQIASYQLNIAIYYTDITDDKSYYSILLNVVDLPKSIVSKIEQLSNLGPPYFSQVLIDKMEIEAGSQEAIYIPSITDPYEQIASKPLMTINLGDTLVFAELNSLDNSIILAPLDKDVRDKPYEITITLSNTKALPLSRAYIIQVFVTPNSQLDLITSEQIQQSLKVPSQTVQTPSTFVVKQKNATTNDLLARLKKTTSDGQLIIRFSDPLIIQEDLTIFNKSTIQLKVIPFNNEQSQNTSMILRKSISNWNVTKFTSQEMTLWVNFTDPSAISPRAVNTDDIQIKILANALFKRVKDQKAIEMNYTIKGPLPMQVVYTKSIVLMQSFAGASAKSMAYATCGNLALQIFMSFSMHKIWGMMNTLKLLSSMLKFNLQVPGNVFLFFKFIEDYLNMRADFIDSGLDYIMEQMLHIKDDFEENLSGQMSTLVENKNTIKELGTYFFATIGILSAMLLTVLIGVLAKYSERVRMIIAKVKSKLFFNSISRLMVQQYFKFSIISLVAIQTFDFQSSPSRIVQSCVNLLILCVVLFFPIFTNWFLRRNLPKLGEPDFKQKFDSLYLNINPALKHSILLTTIFLLRRLSLAIAMTFLPAVQALQLLVVQIQNIAIITYLVKVQPFQDPVLNYFELFNEIVLMTSSLLLFAFGDNTPSYNLNEDISNYDSDENARRMNIGWLLIGVVSLNIAVTMGNVLYLMLRTLYTLIKGLLTKVLSHFSKAKPTPLPLHSQIDDLSFKQSHDYDSIKKECSIVTQKSIDITQPQNEEGTSKQKIKKRILRRQKTTKQLINKVDKQITEPQNDQASFEQQFQKQKTRFVDYVMQRHRPDLLTDKDVVEKPQRFVEPVKKLKKNHEFNKLQVEEYFQKV